MLVLSEAQGSGGRRGWETLNYRRPGMGQALVPEARRQGWEVLATDAHDLDITDAGGGVSGTGPAAPEW